VDDPTEPVLALQQRLAKLTLDMTMRISATRSWHDSADAEDVCRDDIDATTLIDQAVQKPGGRPSKPGNNIPSLGRPSGTTRDRSLRRLRDQRPDLRERVVAKELAPHRAIIEAGF
jgi:hypothetical protein